MCLQDYQVVQLPPHTSQAATAQQLLQQQQLQLPPQQQRYQQLPPQLRMDSNVRSIRHAAGAASAAALFALPQQKQQQQLSWQRLGLRWLHGDCEPDTAACIKVGNQAFMGDWLHQASHTSSTCECIAWQANNGKSLGKVAKSAFFSSTCSVWQRKLFIIQCSGFIVSSL